MIDMGLNLEAVYYYESRAQTKLKNYSVSNELLRIALSKAINRTAEWYYDDLGDNYESMKDYRQALAHYDTAYYLFKDPLVLYTCGRICESELHNNVLARRYFKRYLALAKPETAEEKKVYKYVKERCRF
jgi:tetratricopeptide (TPR) repeat protein